MTTRPVLVISGASGLIGSHLIEAAKDRYDLPDEMRAVLAA